MAKDIKEIKGHESLVEEAVSLDREIARKQARLDEIKTKLQKHADKIEDGDKSVRIVGAVDGHSVLVSNASSWFVPDEKAVGFDRLFSNGKFTHVKIEFVVAAKPGTFYPVKHALESLGAMTEIKRKVSPEAVQEDGADAWIDEKTSVRVKVEYKK